MTNGPYKSESKHASDADPSPVDLKILFFILKNKIPIFYKKLNFDEIDKAKVCYEVILIFFNLQIRIKEFI